MLLLFFAGTGIGDGLADRVGATVDDWAAASDACATEASEADATDAVETDATERIEYGEMAAAL